MILIADSGSTKADWYLIGDKNEKKFISEGINPFYQNEDDIIKSLEKVYLKYINTDISKLIFYGAGCRGEKIEIVKAALAQSFPSIKTIEVHSDLLAAAHALCGQDIGIACILGTGSNSCLYDGENIIYQQASLGFWLGDEGSGGNIGKTFLQYFLRDELPEALYNQFLNSSYFLNKESIMDRAYNKPFPNRFFASFSPFLKENVKDEFVKNLISKSFNDFIEFNLRKYPGVKKYKIHFTGSIAYYFQEILSELLKNKGLQQGKIIQMPGEGLIDYYTKKK